MIDEPTLDDDGYPSEQTLEAIKKWEYNDDTKFVDLLEYVNKVWHWTDYMQMRETQNSFGDDVYEYTCVTGGWSGNEDLISALEQNFMFWALCWRESHRGGRHVFECKKGSPTHDLP